MKMPKCMRTGKESKMMIDGDNSVNKHGEPLSDLDSSLHTHTYHCIWFDNKINNMGSILLHYILTLRSRSYTIFSRSSSSNQDIDLRLDASLRHSIAMANSRY